MALRKHWGVAGRFWSSSCTELMLPYVRCWISADTFPRYWEARLPRKTWNGTPISWLFLESAWSIWRQPRVGRIGLLSNEPPAPRFNDWPLLLRRIQSCRGPGSGSRCGFRSDRRCTGFLPGRLSPYRAGTGAGWVAASNCALGRKAEPFHPYFPLRRTGAQELDSSGRF